MPCIDWNKQRNQEAKKTLVDTDHLNSNKNNNNNNNCNNRENIDHLFADDTPSQLECINILYGFSISLLNAAAIHLAFKWISGTIPPQYDTTIISTTATLPKGRKT